MGNGRCWCGRERAEAHDGARLKSGCHLVRGSSHVEAWGSSHVEARDSSHVVAWGSSHVVARDSSHVQAGAYASASVYSSAALRGGVRTNVPLTAEDWLIRSGVKAEDGAVVLYKATGADWETRNGYRYEPGTMVEAEDWRRGGDECGGGLHFAATPGAAGLFRDGAKRYVACRVSVADMAEQDQVLAYPDKWRARRCEVLYEVTADGDRIEGGE